MKIFYSNLHKQHVPPHEIFNGHADPHAEVPERIERIHTALERIGCDFSAPLNFSEDILSEVHAPEYVSFLRSSKDWKNGYEYPSVFKYTNYPSQTINHIARKGEFSFDLYTPISASTYDVAWESARLALSAAQSIQNGEVSYALCRPPGHHAEIRQMGGYCYFNNAALAAQYLSRGSKKVAILDIDFHHGNGTQHIFYNRSDVLTISIHADPQVKFPFFSGFADEKGIAEGEGFNINIPLSLGVTDAEYDQVLDSVFPKIRAFKPDYLLIAVGYDTHETDPIGGFKITTTYYATMAKRILGLGLPTAFIQEGGYNTEILGDNAASLVSAVISSTK